MDLSNNFANNCEIVLATVAAAFTNGLIFLSFRSILTYSRIGGRVKTLTFCQGSHYLAIASDNGAVQLLGIEASKLPKSPKIHPLQSRYCLSSFYLSCSALWSFRPATLQCGVGQQELLHCTVPLGALKCRKVLLTKDTHLCLALEGRTWA